MAVQLSDLVRNNRLDSIESTIGASAVLKIRTGAAPSTCAGADTGTVLASLTLPSDWMLAASGGVKAKSGTWSDSSADAGGTAQHFRIYDSGGSTCHLQGTVGTSAADLVVDSTAFSAGQSFTISAFQLTEANALAMLPNAIQGALRPSIVISWYETGTTTALDLTGATLTGFIQNGNSTAAIAGVLTVTDAPGGIFQWDLAAADVAETGRFQVQFVATYPTNPTPAKTFLASWLVERSLVET